MTCLITIFNVNDPTPTALSIRSHNPSEINILVIGRTEFTKQQQKAMVGMLCRGWLPFS